MDNKQGDASAKQEKVEELRNISADAGISREQYSECVLLLFENANFKGKEAETVTQLKMLTRQLAKSDPWLLGG